jgi:hypothetical protein
VNQQPDVNLKWHDFPLQLHGVAQYTKPASYIARAHSAVRPPSGAVDQVLARTASNGQGIPSDFVILGLDNANSKVNLQLCANSSETALLVDQER